jgi:hypothetical protein
MTKWMNLGVSGQCGWPDSQIEIHFGTTMIILMPETGEKSASIHLETHSNDGLDEMTMANRFLSIVSWAYKQSLQNDYGWSGSPMPCAVSKMNLARSINPDLLIRWHPLDDPKQRLAVALYREAMSVNSIPYKVLGFFKIINILYKNGPAQIVWIKETLPKLTKKHLRDRILALSNAESDVPNYLFVSCRCAVAHGSSDPLVDPDDLTHLRRLSADVDIVQALAEYLIKHELNVPDYP